MLKKYKKMTPDEYAAEMRRLSNKPLLSSSEAAEYFHIGIVRMGQLLQEPSEYRVTNGRYRLVHRERFEEFLKTHGGV